MTSRILPPEEWPKLAGTEAGQVWPVLDPAKSKVVVLELDGTIVGTHIIMDVKHVECLWLHPSVRSLDTMRTLWNAVREEASKDGTKVVLTASIDTRVTRLLKYLHATPLPGEHYAVPLMDTIRGESCPQ